MLDPSASANRMTMEERIASWKRSRAQRDHAAPSLYDAIEEQELEEYVVTYGKTKDGCIVFEVAQGGNQKAHEPTEETARHETDFGL